MVHGSTNSVGWRPSEPGLQRCGRWWARNGPNRLWPAVQLWQVPLHFRNVFLLLKVYHILFVSVFMVDCKERILLNQVRHKLNNAVKNIIKDFLLFLRTNYKCSLTSKFFLGSRTRSPYHHLEWKGSLSHEARKKLNLHLSKRRISVKILTSRSCPFVNSHIKTTSKINRKQKIRKTLV